MKNAKENFGFFIKLQFLDFYILLDVKLETRNFWDVPVS